jgi:hypothetical protein
MTPYQWKLLVRFMLMVLATLNRGDTFLYKDLYKEHVAL